MYGKILKVFADVTDFYAYDLKDSLFILVTEKVKELQKTTEVCI